MLSANGAYDLVHMISANSAYDLCEWLVHLGYTWITRRLQSGYTRLHVGYIKFTPHHCDDVALLELLELLEFELGLCVSAWKRFVAGFL